MICTFFGHKEAPDHLIGLLKRTIIDLIEKNGANIFYVGNQGNFDRMVHKTLSELKIVYPHITYFVVLAYIPTHADYSTDYSDTIYPDGLEKVPLKFAISKRNIWMIEQSDTVITYVVHSVGGAAQFQKRAIKKNKNVINLADIEIDSKTQCRK